MSLLQSIGLYDYLNTNSIIASYGLQCTSFFGTSGSIANLDEQLLMARFLALVIIGGLLLIIALPLRGRRDALDKLHEEEVRRLEMEKRLEAMKVEALKNQINPHFLFNTLNVIAGMAMLENAETTEKMIKSLSGLFRYNLQNSEMEATLTQELKVVHDYMYIQQMRFGDRVKCHVDCRVDEKYVRIPRFTFQPLVENAIIHGLSPKEEGGEIYIRIQEVCGKLIITICDTGVGMDAKTLKNLKEGLKRDEYSHSNIGLCNVWNRLKLTYPDSGFQIRSKQQVGTVVRISIPCDPDKNER